MIVEKSENHTRFSLNEYVKHDSRNMSKTKTKTYIPTEKLKERLNSVNMHRKVKTNIYVDRDLWDRFKALAFEVCHGSHGCISRCVEEALRSWTQNASTQISLAKRYYPKLSPYPTLRRADVVWSHVWCLICEYYGYEPKEFTYEDLARAITQVRGHDRRTIKRWISTFIRVGLIRSVGRGIYERA